MKLAGWSLSALVLGSMQLWACREPIPQEETPVLQDEGETSEEPLEEPSQVPVEDERAEEPPPTPTPTLIRVVNESGASLTLNHAERFLFLRAEPVDGDESYYLEGSRPPLLLCPDQGGHASGIEDHEDEDDRTAFALAAGRERLLEWSGWFHLYDHERECFWRRPPLRGTYRFTACAGAFSPSWPRAGPCASTTVSVPASGEINLRFAGP